jgi:hypothetical protein
MASLFGGKRAFDRKDRKGKPQRTLSETLDLLFFALFAAFSSRSLRSTAFARPRTAEPIPESSSDRNFHPKAWRLHLKW